MSEHDKYKAVRVSPREITLRQRDILKYILECNQTQGYSPTITEIGEAVGLSSTHSVHNNLHSLEKKGYLRIHPKRSRGIELLKIIDDGIERPTGVNQEIVRMT